ncbi:deoxyuridine 5'-triphosphate nucleotidohydrolase [Salinarchaeum sp. Harcht-Bsk1]|uniref:deoxyuridine 5'-triphosphate nucleotidohydrolase n=1 Tax=Salinarchaeum sp. Harcht-Bsk1 TaxID=1333523 RepID=UPI0003423E9F|nr:deoxyuridine 5'-triphosphate nucleotidohydrolase [Salinarchaeum sp. Harcht-Bsk1]AGN01861.1 deoxyuridine 5'-triphosphate nucleotidohydrolase [Salinarchaeum sp. Harcht-Bsk1]
MFRSGAFVADHIRPIDEEQVQPNGVDLTLDAVLEPNEVGRIGRDGKTVAERTEIEPEGEDRVFHLDPGGYVVRYTETVGIPEEHVGFILPRSSLMRNGTTLETAVWDAGYEGKGEGLLQVTHPIEIEQGARFGQIVLAAADHEGLYDGSYQGERLD